MPLLCFSTKAAGLGYSETSQPFDSAALADVSGAGSLAALLVGFFRRSSGEQLHGLPARICHLVCMFRCIRPEGVVGRRPERQVSEGERIPPAPRG